MAQPDTVQTSDEIIASMMAPAPEPVAEEVAEEIAEEVAEEPIADEVLEDDNSEEEAEEADSEDNDAPDEGGDDTDDTEQTADADTDENYLDILDEDEFEVKIDGEWVTRTVKEAKDALSGDGAVQKRLQEVTELRNTLTEERATGILELEQKRTELMKVVGQLESVIFQPTVAPPNEGLRNSDPTQYLLHKEMFDNDQLRVQHGRTQLAENLRAQQAQQAQNMDTYRAEQQRSLLTIMPELNDANVAPDLLARMGKAARVYGFSEQDIGGAMDHRYFLMARDAMKYQELRQQAKADVAAGDTPEKIASDAKKKRPIRRLRSGTAQRKTAASQSAKKARDTQARARSSGTQADIIAAMMK